MADQETPRTLTLADLQGFMARHGIRGEILSLDVPTPTVEAAARAVEADPEQIVKSILFLVDGQPVLAISCGTSRVDRRVLAALYGVGRKRARLASEEDVQAISGYPVGAMPPFGHQRPLTTLIDPTVLEQEEVFAGGGAEHALVRLASKEILRVTRAQVVPLHEPPSQEN